MLASTAAAAASSLQSCPTLCNPIDGSPPGSPVPGILQARTLEWVAISFSNERKWKVKVKSLSRVRLFETPWPAAYQAPPSMGFSRQEYWSGVPSLPYIYIYGKMNQAYLYIYPLPSGFSSHLGHQSANSLCYTVFPLVVYFISHSIQSVVSNSLWPHGLQQARLSCPTATPIACSNLCPLSQWCHPTISSSIIPFSYCLQFFPLLGSFPISQFFASGGQTIGASTLASVLPMNIQDWLPFRLTALILQSKGLSGVFSNTIVQMHQFLGAQLYL